MECSWKWIVIHWDIGAGRLQCRICIPDYPYRSVMPVCHLLSNFILRWRVDIYRIVSSKTLESSTSDIAPPKSSINVGPSVDSNANQGSKCCWFCSVPTCPLLDNNGGVWIVTADTCSPFAKGKFSGCMSTHIAISSGFSCSYIISWFSSLFTQRNGDRSSETSKCDS